MTRAELDKILARNPQLSVHENPAGPSVQSTKSQPNPRPALEPVSKRATQSLERVAVFIIGYSIRPLDADNFAGGCKALLDGLRHAGLIPDDSPEAITLSFEQQRVRKRKDERTEILISIP